MKETIILHQHFNASPEDIYNAWLDSKEHTAMTGGEAECSDKAEGVFTTWDGYISGRNIKLVPNMEIVQNWRTSEFLEDDEDSVLKIRLSKVKNGTEMTLHHSNIPEGQLQYETGWKEHYFEPMTEYFDNKKAN